METTDPPKVDGDGVTGARRAAALPASGIRRIMDLSRGMDDVIHLEVGEPDWATPAHVIAAAHEAALAGFTKYTPNAGLLGLRQAVAERFSTSLDRPVQSDQVIVTPGAVAAIASALFALLDPGDEVLVPDPGWPNTTSAALLAGAVPVSYPLVREHAFQPDLDALRARIGPRTRALVINSPSNPTGCVFPENTVRRLLDIAEEHDLWLISDEIYEDFVFDGIHVSPARFDTSGRVIVISGVSKSYAMTGWRIGYAIAPHEIAATLTKLQEPLVSCASAVSQRAAEAALRGPQTFVRDMVAAYRQRRDIVVAELEATGALAARPAGAFYALLSVGGNDADDAAQRLLEEARVAVAPGPTFGEQARSYVRISFATETSLLQEGLRRIRQHLDRYQA